MLSRVSHFMRALRAAAAVLPPVLAAAPALAATTSYFEGAQREVSLRDGHVSDGQTLLARTLDPQASTLTEIACVREAGRPAVISPVFMRVAEDGKLTITDQPDLSAGRVLTGSGEALGEPWHWPELHFSMQVRIPNGPSLRIEDANFAAGEKMVGRKQMFLLTPQDPHGAPVQLWDIDMAPLTAEQFHARAKDMGCPAYPGF